ncbi:DUF500-domain-containing protein [Thelephora terrestris]|uniref:DUF500-domain-containing protein n=1 Tax=Thelephora terrestris TaxID=56493 RepID=A0A9P6L9M9_9AGAM|nr:DUF500-domain-containing protein [Thelephora terrestris]
MKLNNPLPQALPKECAKAARIFKSFVDHGNNGLDGVIPRTVLENAQGFAIFTVFKAGFLFSARAGSGIVVAKLPDGSWSAPSAIGTAGLGVGTQAGAEMTDFLIVLNSHSAIKSFMAAGSLTLGGNLSIALGPLGRNGEALGSLNTSGKLSAMYSYSKTKGLFGGISVEGSVIAERQDANTLAYHSDVSVKGLLSGAVPRPEWAQPLYQTLDACTKFRGGQREWIDDTPAHEQEYAFTGLSGPNGEQQPRTLQKRKKTGPSLFPPASWGEQKPGGSYFHDSANTSTSRGASGPAWDPASQDSKHSTSNFETHFESDYNPHDDRFRHMHNRGFSLSVVPTPKSQGSFGSGRDDFYASDDSWQRTSRANTSSSPYSPYNRPPTTTRTPSMPVPGLSPTTSSPFDYEHNGQIFDEPAPMVTRPVLTPKAELATPLTPGEGVGRAIALFDFNAVEPGDLSFTKGEVITITQKTGTADTWWTGKVNGRSGTFPANFVELV